MDTPPENEGCILGRWPAPLPCSWPEEYGAALLVVTAPWGPGCTPRAGVAGKEIDCGAALCCGEDNPNLSLLQLLLLPGP